MKKLVHTRKDRVQTCCQEYAGEEGRLPPKKNFKMLRKEEKGLIFPHFTPQTFCSGYRPAECQLHCRQYEHAKFKHIV